MPRMNLQRLGPSEKWVVRPEWTSLLAHCLYLHTAFTCTPPSGETSDSLVLNLFQEHDCTDSYADTHHNPSEPPLIQVVSGQAADVAANDRADGHNDRRAPDKQARDDEKKDGYSLTRCRDQVF